MNVALIGYGKMGREIERLLLARGHRIGLIVDADNAADLNPEKLRDIDMAIEFSTPDTAFDNVCKCLSAKVPVVCGTTAWIDRLPEVEALCRERGGAFFYASNYSIGVNLVFRINVLLAKMMNRFEEYDVSLEEVHHIQKKDAPSGTAVTLADGILEGLERKKRWVGQTTTDPQELEILSVRRSSNPGVHTITYESDSDIVTLQHASKSRVGLARGAVAAAEFLAGKQGVYTMEDLLAQATEL